MFLSRRITITKSSDRNRTASLYAAGALGVEDINKIIGGQAIKVKKADIPSRLLAEVVLKNGDDIIPLDTATEAEIKEFPKVLWYSNQGKEVDAEEDAVFIKDFYACLEALETGKRMTEPNEEEETTEESSETEESTGSEGSGSEGTGNQEPDTPDTPADLTISDADFAALSQEEKIKFIEKTQTESERLNKRATELAKTVSKDMKRGAKADARIEQLYDLLKTLVKPKEVALVEKLQESGTDPVIAAKTFFDIDLLQAEKDVKKHPKPKKAGGKSDESEKTKFKKDKKDKPGETDETDKPEEPDESGAGENEPEDTDDQPKPEPANPKGVKLRGNAIMASLRKNGMLEKDIKVMAEDIDVRAKYDLGEIISLVRELGYAEDSSVIQALSATK